MSHGRMAEGMLDSSKLFFGDDIPQIKALCLMASDNPEEFDEKIRAAVEEIDDGQGVIAMCDLLGGTPCN
ncbi:MAG: PTS mannose transporter subunit IIA, partial [Erysipelotrichaceae bacterium]|nr:PTS mannose transporter subunit IIA [Erysipelotrichaceae bacterium]